jgi:hypothetical protein
VKRNEMEKLLNSFYFMVILIRVYDPLTERGIFHTAVQFACSDAGPLSLSINYAFSGRRNL